MSLTIKNVGYHKIILLLSNYFSVPDRPKRLLVLLNPASGKFREREIHEKIVTPLFEMADIQTDVIGKSPIQLKFLHLNAVISVHYKRSVSGTRLFLLKFLRVQDELNSVKIIRGKYAFNLNSC